MTTYTPKEINNYFGMTVGAAPANSQYPGFFPDGLIRDYPNFGFLHNALKGLGCKSLRVPLENFLFTEQRDNPEFIQAIRTFFQRLQLEEITPVALIWPYDSSQGTGPRNKAALLADIRSGESQFGQFLDTLRLEFNGLLTHGLLLNEPDLNQSTSPTAAEYIEILQFMRTRLGDDFVLLGPSITSQQYNLSNTDTWVNEFIAGGGLDVVDEYTHHMYQRWGGNVWLPETCLWTGFLKLSERFTQNGIVGPVKHRVMEGGNSYGGDGYSVPKDLKAKRDYRQFLSYLAGDSIFPEYFDLQGSCLFHATNLNRDQRTPDTQYGYLDVDSRHGGLELYDTQHARFLRRMRLTMNNTKYLGFVVYCPTDDEIVFSSSSYDAVSRKAFVDKLRPPTKDFYAKALKWQWFHIVERNGVKGVLGYLANINRVNGALEYQAQESVHLNRVYEAFFQEEAPHNLGSLLLDEGPELKLF